MTANNLLPIYMTDTVSIYRIQILTGWCKGNTLDFDSSIAGSNPVPVAK